MSLGATPDPEREPWVVRHAPVDAPGLCYGRLDVPVAVAAEDAGRQVLAALAARGAPRFGRVWSSPAPRCAALGAVLARALAVELAVDARLHELSFGDWEGRPWAALEREDGARLAAWMEAWQRVAPPGGETVGALEDRVRAWRADADAARASDGGPGLLVAHAGVVRALRVLARRTSWAEAFAAPVPHLVPEPL